MSTLTLKSSCNATPRLCSQHLRHQSTSQRNTHLGRFHSVYLPSLRGATSRWSRLASHSKATTSQPTNSNIFLHHCPLTQVSRTPNQ
ncbi:uncharacterized protein MELLADRAFT_88970 [Melampsora larici-populina 98AG31]|uniref:Uncharacterized protein n=1 Tax=Melampsora larici-populina (strain 98AG31 / pathotype 3-4-7) TaxID=747676 RepID=F4R6G9_MELLP|nr:uncharacterized protein MELLADRAFT_88970 [Melampsora larici-populina 98AG31]EGG12466.1 hypothetical protein MELLADRAFT_88970 [Melampsora larici-populina 98AG31]